MNTLTFRTALGCVLLAGCGRIGFDPVHDGTGSPRAVIMPISPLACGQSTVALDGSRSEPAPGGPPLETFTWTFYDPQGLAMFSIVGDADEILTGSAHLMGRTAVDPIVKLVPFSGANAARIVVTNSTGFNQFYQRNLVMTEGPYRIRLSGFSVNGTNLRVDTVEHDDDFTPYSPVLNPIDLTDQWQSHSYEFEAVNVTGGVADARLRIRLTGVDEFWLDDVVLERRDTGIEATSNSSMEEGLLSWFSNFDGAGATSLQPVTASDAAAFEGSYRIELVVADVEGMESLPSEDTVNFALCP